MRRSGQTMEERFLRTGAIEPPARRGLPRFARMLLAGLARFAALVTVAAGISVGAAVLIGWGRDSDLWRSATLGLYLGGALLIVVPLLGAGGRSYGSGDYVFYDIETDPEARRAWRGTLWTYLAVGVTLVGLGIVLETLA
jgi:hypothetical protein